MIIEFLGLPTCGKSTVDRALSKHLRALGWSSVSLQTLDAQDGKIRPVLRRNPIARATYRLDRLRETHTEFFDFLDEVSGEAPVQRALLLDCLIKQDLTRSLPQKVDLVTFDEGLWHRLAAIVSKTQNREKYTLVEIVPQAPAIDGLVFIESKPEETLERSMKRIDNRNNGKLDEDTLIKRAVAGHGSIEDLQKRLSLLEAIADNLERAGTRVVRLMARQPLEEMVNTIVNQFEISKKAGFFA